MTSVAKIGKRPFPSCVASYSGELTCHLSTRGPLGKAVPSQPTAAADADRRSGVRLPARTRGSAAVGEVDRRVRVCESPGRLVGRVWSCGRSSPVLVVWVGSPASGWLVFSIFPGKEKISVGASFVSGCQSGVLFVCLLACLLRQVSPRSSCSTVFVVVALARARLAIGGGVYAHFWLITRASSGCAVRCFRGLLRWRVLVVLIKETGVFVRLRLRLRRDARHRRPPPTPATDARHRRPPPTPATDARQKPRLEPEPAGDARGRSRMPLKTPTAHRGRIYRETPPCGVLERFLLHLLCFTSALPNQKKQQTKKQRGLLPSTLLSDTLTYCAAH